MRSHTKSLHKGTLFAVELAMRRVLLLDENKDTRGFHVLMLNLSGCRVTETRTPAEALDRIIAERDGETPFRLLLISNFSPFAPFQAFVADLRKAGVRLPVLVIERPENPEALPAFGVLSCPPDDVAERVLDLLDPPGLSSPPRRPPLPSFAPDLRGELRLG